MSERPDRCHFPERREPIDPLDEAGIERAFVERPCADVELRANHLTRPDAFAKILILGRLPNLYWYPQRTIGHAVEFLSLRR